MELKFYIRVQEEDIRVQEEFVLKSSFQFFFRVRYVSEKYYVPHNIV